MVVADWLQCAVIEIRSYQTADGLRPFDEWLADIRDLTAKARVGVRLARVRAGNFGDAKSVASGVLELRIDHGPGYRVYFGRQGDRLVLLLPGGDKRTQAKDIDKAEELLE